MSMTNNSLELLVKLGVNDGESKKNLNAEIASLQKQLESVKIDIKIDPQAITSLKTLASMDFSKLTQSINGLKTDLKGVGQSAKIEANTIQRSFKEVAPTIDAAFSHLGKNLQTQMRKGITSVDELKTAFKGLSPTFTIGKEIITKNDQLTAEKMINGITVSYKNLQGQIERVKLTNKEFIDMGNGKLKPIFQPVGDSKVIDKTMSDITRLGQTTQAQLTKMRAEGKLTEKQFGELSTAITRAGSSQNGKTVEANFARLNQRIQESVQSTKNLTAAQRETEAAQKRLIDNENKRKNLIIDIERALKNQAKGYDTAGAQRLLAQTKQLDTSAKNFGQTIAANRTALRQMSADASVATKQSMSIIDSFKIAMERFPIWMAASTAFYGSIRTAREFMSIIIDIDTKMVGLTKVMADDTDFGALFDSATESAERFGQSISAVLDSYNEFARQGFKGDELAGLADSGLVAANVGEMTAQSASEYMTASLIQWKKDASESMGIIDSWNEISNNYATTTEKLAQGQAW